MKNSSASFSLIILGLFLTLHLTSAASLLKASNVQLPDNLRSKLIKSDIQHSLSSYLSTVSRASTNKVKQCGTIDFARLTTSLLSCTGCFSDVKLPNGENVPDPSQLGLSGISGISFPENEECPEDCCVSLKILSSTSVETIVCGTDGCCHRVVAHTEDGFEDILNGNVNATAEGSVSGVADFNVFSFNGKNSDGQCKTSESSSGTCTPRCATSFEECEEDEIMVPELGKPLVKDACTGEDLPGADSKVIDENDDKKEDSESTTSSSGEPNADTNDSNGDDDDDDEPACFPADSNVRLADHSTVQMNKLNIGDIVQCGNGQTSPIIAFSHRQQQGRNSFVELITQDGFTVRATKGHLMNVGGSMKQMQEVNVGDSVTSMRGTTQVTHIRTVMDKGLYNPHTECGQIEVDGVVMSTYTSAVDEVTAHAVFMPIRASMKWMPVARVMGAIVENASDVGRYFISQGYGAIVASV